MVLEVLTAEHQTLPRRSRPARRAGLRRRRAVAEARRGYISLNISLYLPIDLARSPYRSRYISIGAPRPEALPWLASVEEAAGGHEALLGREPERTPALLALSERLTSPQADPNPNPNPNP